MSNKTPNPLHQAGRWPIVVASLISWIVLVYAMVMSSSHIIETSLKIGLTGWAAYTSPILIDAVAAVGKLGRLERFTDATRRSSLWLFLFGGAMSLTANVYAGENLGQRIHGVLVVVVYVWLESHITKLKLRPVPVDEPAVEQTTVTEVKADDAKAPDLPAAPVSPAMGPRGPYGPRDPKKGYSKRQIDRQKAAAAAK
jgi:hypothetical protein